jgi:hypothetical protein
MRFGIRLGDWFGSTQTLVELALTAEKEGFDYCWVSHDVFMRSSLVTLTTIRLRIKENITRQHDT